MSAATGIGFGVGFIFSPIISTIVVLMLCFTGVFNRTNSCPVCQPCRAMSTTTRKLTNGPDYTSATFTSTRPTTGKPATPPPPPTCPRDLSPISQSHFLQKITGSSSSNIYRQYKCEIETQFSTSVAMIKFEFLTETSVWYLDNVSIREKYATNTYSFASSDFGSPSHDYLTQIMNVKGTTSYVIEFYLAFVGNAGSTTVTLDTR
ncbi:unnamed protein product [Adineta ricciae]|uniref:Uncharacterized protein n=1 Tax=Adineta ricciae TaxID=249248 RepID=A0A815HJV6_ADIRI|nr:unnamed protein product [Adineta ricciae]CAF1354974.1 unnamed protein product [Adineta ricciae]